MFQDIINNYNIEYDSEPVNSCDVILAYSSGKMLYNIDNNNLLSSPLFRYKNKYK